MSFSLGRGQVLQPGANCIKSEVSTLHRKESPLVDVLRTLWPSPIFLLPLKEPDLRNSTECARRKRHEYFSLPASREENFFYNLHEGFFLKNCMYSWIQTKMYCTREKECAARPLSRSYAAHLSVLRRQQHPPLGSRGGRLQELLNASSLNVRKWNI